MEDADRFPVDSHGREVELGSDVRLAGLLGDIGRVVSLDTAVDKAAVQWRTGASVHPTWDLTVVPKR